MTDTAYQKRLAKRYASERRFKACGATALALTSAFLIYLLVDIAIKAWPAFVEHRVSISIDLDAAKIDKANPQDADYAVLLKDAWRAQFPEMASRSEKKKLNAMLSQDAAISIRDTVIANPELVGTTLKADVLLSDDADLYFKSLSQEADTAVLDAMKAKSEVSKHFSWRLFSNGDSREPELAGLRGAIIGSLLTVAIALWLGLPLGIAAAIYLEQFAPQNRWTDLSQYQQPCSRALDHLRFAGPCHVFECVWYAAFSAACRRIGVGSFGASNNYYCFTSSIESCATVYQRGRFGCWCIASAGCISSRGTLGAAGHSDRCYSGNGPCLW
jgi:Domain of unknown function (DUF3333)